MGLGKKYRDGGRRERERKEWREQHAERDDTSNLHYRLEFLKSSEVQTTMAVRTADNSGFNSGMCQQVVTDLTGALDKIRLNNGLWDHVYLTCLSDLSISVG